MEREIGAHTVHIPVDIKVDKKGVWITKKKKKDTLKIY